MSFNRLDGWMYGWTDGEAKIKWRQKEMGNALKLKDTCSLHLIYLIIIIIIFIILI